jgi:hypothetical protein
MQRRVCPVSSFLLACIRRQAQQRGEGSGGTVSDGGSWVIGTVFGLAVLRLVHSIRS